MLLDRHLEPLRPLPAQRDVAHPRHPRQRAPRAIEIHREEGAGELFADGRLDVRRARPFQRAVHDRPRETRTPAGGAPTRARPTKTASTATSASARRDGVHLSRVIPHARLAGFRRTARRNPIPPPSPPSARANGRSSPATCSPRETERAVGPQHEVEPAPAAATHDAEGGERCRENLSFLRFRDTARDKSTSVSSEKYLL